MNAAVRANLLRSTPQVVHKTVVSVTRAADGDLEFVLSDETVDRYGDVIRADGWDLTNFKKNPIALFNHDSKFPIGTWTKVRVEGKKLIGKLKLAMAGTSDRLDEIIKLVEQGVLRAVSVGFKPITMESLADNSGILFKEQELLETSLVSVPANPSAVQLARSLGASQATIELVFGEQARAGRVERQIGEQARNQPNSNGNKMTLSERIQLAQKRVTALKDEQTKAIEAMGEHDDNEAATALVDELNNKIDLAEKALKALTDAEQRLQASVETRGTDVVIEGRAERTSENPRTSFAVPRKKLSGMDLIVRACVVKVVAHRSKQDFDSVRQRIYGDDEPTKVISEWVTKASTAPATTTTSGWASQLVQQVNADFIDTLMPQSAYPGLAAAGLRLSFGANGIISIPTRSATPTIAGSFVGEGSPIPVRQGAFSAATLTPKKMAVISTFTREIAEHSVPAIEGLIRQAIQEDTSVAIDTVLLDATAASTIRPAGLRNGVTVFTATAGGGFAALVGDIKGLLGLLVSGSNGNLRNPVWIMNPIQAISVSLTQNAGGDFPFKQEINQNRLQGYPLIQSATVPAGMVILVDAADFVTVTGDDPRFDLSDTATIHLDDTTPLAIGTAGSPNTVAAPVRSLWQTDTLGLRMILPMNWTMRRTGVVAWTQTVTW